MNVVRIAAVGDLHCTKTSQGSFQPFFTRATELADMLLLAGDLTNTGLPDEARVLAREIAGARVPVVAVLGNHDVESGQEATVRLILEDAGVVVLDGDAREIQGIGIAGVKGFGGGFGAHALGPWGEAGVKQFVREAVDEALKLETALAKLRDVTIVALLHYSPVPQTVRGEPLEIYPFLGSSRLEEPINRYPVSLVLHGHAHRGELDGSTQRGAAVYNVSMPLLARRFPDRPACRVFEVPTRERATDATAAAAVSPSLVPASAGAPGGGAR